MFIPAAVVTERYFQVGAITTTAVLFMHSGDEIRKWKGYEFDKIKSQSQGR